MTRKVDASPQTYSEELRALARLLSVHARTARSRGAHGLADALMEAGVAALTWATSLDEEEST